MVDENELCEQRGCARNRNQNVNSLGEINILISFKAVCSKVIRAQAK